MVMFAVVVSGRALLGVHHAMMVVSAHTHAHLVDDLRGFCHLRARQIHTSTENLHDAEHDGKRGNNSCSYITERHNLTCPYSLPTYTPL